MTTPLLVGILAVVVVLLLLVLSIFPIKIKVNKDD
jgi:uncharacterized membrane protein YqiK